MHLNSQPGSQARHCAPQTAPLRAPLAPATTPWRRHGGQTCRVRSGRDLTRRLNHRMKFVRELGRNPSPGVPLREISRGLFCPPFRTGVSPEFHNVSCAKKAGSRTANFLLPSLKLSCVRYDSLSNSSASLSTLSLFSSSAREPASGGTMQSAPNIPRVSCCGTIPVMW